MARPRAFDREAALERAMRLFWAKGFAATSTDDLVQAMGIGRQSLYNAFGDKKRLYREALAAYLRRVSQCHLARLTAPASPLVGIRDLLQGLVAAEDGERRLGCMGVAAVAEFGSDDPDLVAERTAMATSLGTRLAARLSEGQALGEIDPAIEVEVAARFVQATMAGIQLAARAGSDAETLRTLARFAADRLRPP